MKLAVRALAELGPDVVLAPERWVAAAGAGEGTPLDELVVERRERADAIERAVVLDTTHARGFDIPAAVRAAPRRGAEDGAGGPRLSRVRTARSRSFIRARSRPHPLVARRVDRFVLAPRLGNDLAFLLPFLLGERAQSVLAAAQEGGHHPRVPRSSLLALRVPSAIVAARRRLSREVNGALDVLYDASARYQRLLNR